MIGDTDTVCLAPGVSFAGGWLTDEVRGDSWPLNATATFVLSRADRPLGTIVRELADAFELPRETARADVLGFLWLLNTLALVNVELGVSRLRRLRDWVQLAAHLAPAGVVPLALARRRALDTRSVPRAVASCLRAIFGRICLVAIVATAFAAQLPAIGGLPALALPLALGLGTGLGLGLHEAGHAATLRGVPSALVTRGRRTYVLHARLTPSRRAFVALAGPLGVTMIGLAAVSLGVVAVAPVLVLAGCPLAAHALALTMVGGDGKVACAP